MGFLHLGQAVFLSVESTSLLCGISIRVSHQVRSFMFCIPEDRLRCLLCLRSGSQVTEYHRSCRSFAGRCDARFAMCKEREDAVRLGKLFLLDRRVKTKSNRPSVGFLARVRIWEDHSFQGFRLRHSFKDFLPKPSLLTLTGALLRSYTRLNNPSLIISLLPQIAARSLESGTVTGVRKDPTGKLCRRCSCRCGQSAGSTAEQLQSN